MWRQIENLDYEINEEGVIRRVSSKRIKKSRKRADGYIGAVLYKTKYETVDFLVHRLIAIAFIPNPLNLSYVNHKDTIRDHNYISNLEWCTYQQNVVHSYMMGTSNNKGSHNPFSILNEDQVLEIRRLKNEGKTIRELKEIYHVSYNCIQGIINRINWKHI